MTRKLDDIDHDMLVAARKRREADVENARHLLEVCVCAWPLQIYRNGHGHHPECPRAVEITSKPRDPRARRGG